MKIQLFLKESIISTIYLYALLDSKIYDKIWLEEDMQLIYVCGAYKVWWLQQPIFQIWFWLLDDHSNQHFHQESILLILFLLWTCSAKVFFVFFFKTIKQITLLIKYLFITSIVMFMINQYNKLKGVPIHI